SDCAPVSRLLTSTALDEDIGIDRNDPPAEQLRKTDAYLCELKESQIRDGLHILGRSPGGTQEHSLTAAMLRIPRGDGGGANASLLRALAGDFAMNATFDPLNCPMAEPWDDIRPNVLREICDDPWRTHGDTVERLELFAEHIIAGHTHAPGPASTAVLADANASLRPQIRICGSEELRQLALALDGQFVAPGAAGAPTRGRPDVLPTGRNFHSIDSRALPRRSAWQLGARSAELLVERHRQDHGEWPTSMAVTAWGTSNMRTGGDDLAQAMALIGTKPRWDNTSGRVLGFDVIDLKTLGRPRVDVTLRVSGMFRDAFPAQLNLFASASRAVMERDESPTDNPARAAWLTDCETLDEDTAAYRVFGSPPGGYGAGLQTLINSGQWEDRSTFGETYIEWGHYAYGGAAGGRAAKAAFRRRLRTMGAVVQNQDNREHDVLDSDDYYQFEGGLAAAVELVRGEQPVIYHNDHSRPEHPAIRTLESEVARVVRSRATNPKWVTGMKRHGYKGAFEMAAMLDYLFAFAATTGAAKSHHFDLVYAAYIADDDTRTFIGKHNPDALQDMAARFLEAARRNLWHPRSNSSLAALQDLLEPAPIQ
ncbi:MAG: cobaltochelatase subunit CobN, partial [Rhodobacteraceae bacterium]|nr:cobaltochelatase subunit CobN [Paracoccaceae bacterium]